MTQAKLAMGPLKTSVANLGDVASSEGIVTGNEKIRDITERMTGGNVSYMR